MIRKYFRFFKLSNLNSKNLSLPKKMSGETEDLDKCFEVVSKIVQTAGEVSNINFITSILNVFTMTMLFKSVTLSKSY